jgi:hypothetical protein
MMRLEYDEQKRFVLPRRVCGNRVAISVSAETYCTYDYGHEGNCQPPESQVVTRIPCNCLDCRAKRQGITRQ